VVSGKVDERESEHLRVNVLKPEARARLEKRLRGAVDHATRLRQVFEHCSVLNHATTMPCVFSSAIRTCYPTKVRTPCSRPSPPY
jgi:hypothetical protein